MNLLSQGIAAKSQHSSQPLFLYFSVLNIRHIKVAYGLTIGMGVLSALLSRMQEHGVSKKFLSYASNDTILVSVSGNERFDPVIILDDLHRRPVTVEGVELLLSLDCGLMHYED